MWDDENCSSLTPLECVLFFALKQSVLRSTRLHQVLPLSSSSSPLKLALPGVRASKPLIFQC